MIDINQPPLLIPISRAVVTWTDVPGKRSKVELH